MERKLHRSPRAAGSWGEGSGREQLSGHGIQILNVVQNAAVLGSSKGNRKKI
jgi:hypothetical protein